LLAKESTGENLSLTTEAETSIQNIRAVGPFLQWSCSSVEYSYIVDEIVRINNSNFGDD